MRASRERENERMRDYQTRARELLLNPINTLAFIVLNQHADVNGTCPSCGTGISGYESDRLKHARTCMELLSDIKENPNV